MEQLKVKKKDIIVLNVVIYLVLSFFFVYLQYAYRHHLTPFSEVYFKKSLELFWYVALCLVVSMVLIWNHHRLGLLAYRISVFLVGFKVLEGIFLEFNKIIVITLFFYAIISYFFYQFLAHYLSSAALNTNYRRIDLFRPLLKEITCTISFNDTEIPGHLSNWDHEGCFIKLAEASKIPSQIRLKINFQDREFFQEGEVVARTLDSGGIGIKFLKIKKDINVFNWDEFIELVQELGFRPERLR